MWTLSAILPILCGNSLHKGQWRGALMFLLSAPWINCWVKQSSGWWFETTFSSLWRHCNAKITTITTACELEEKTKLIVTVVINHTIKATPTLVTLTNVLCRAAVCFSYGIVACHFVGLVQDCSHLSALAMQLLKFCTKLSISNALC